MKVDITVTITYTKDLDDSLFDKNHLRRFPPHWSKEDITKDVLNNKQASLEESIYDVAEDLEHTDYDMTVKVTEKED